MNYFSDTVRFIKHYKSGMLQKKSIFFIYFYTSAGITSVAPSDG